MATIKRESIFWIPIYIETLGIMHDWLSATFRSIFLLHYRPAEWFFSPPVHLTCRNKYRTSEGSLGQCRSSHTLHLHLWSSSACSELSISYDWELSMRGWEGGDKTMIYRKRHKWFCHFVSEFTRTITNATPTVLEWIVYYMPQLPHCTIIFPQQPFPI